MDAHLADDTTTPPSSTIAVLGLGPMGVAIAGAAARSGHRVVVWNRTERPLSSYGLDADFDHPVVLAESPTAAVAAASLVVVCVRDHEVSEDLVDRVARVMGDRVLVNVSTGTPAQAAASASAAIDSGVRYVTGAVMVPTPMVGTDDCLVLYAGDEQDIESIAPLMAAFGGAADVVGTDHAVPPALDLAMLDVYFAGMYAFLHSAALAGAHGIEPARYLPYTEAIVDTLRGSLADLTSAIERRSYDAGDARLDMCLAFLELIVASSDEAGIPPGVAAVVRDASSTAMRERPGSTDWDVVAEHLLPAVDAPS